EKSGALLLVKNIELGESPVEITLHPFDDSLETAVVTLQPKEFKRKRVGRVYYLVAKTQVAFDKKKDAPAKPGTEPAEPGKPDGPAPAIPPDEDKDDL